MMGTNNCDELVTVRVLFPLVLLPLIFRKMFPMLNHVPFCAIILLF